MMQADDRVDPQLDPRLDPHLDPKLDLVLERFVAVPPELVWRAWTEPELLKQWFTPKPWRTTHAEIDLRPGGRFRTVMQPPDTEEGGFDGSGCILEVVEGRRLVWTAALGPGWRPQADETDMPFTAIISMEPRAGGTFYTAIAKHRDPEGRQAHADMGFMEGWGAALEQLVELVRTL